MYQEETIAAVATAPGEGGIGIIRISGDESKPILKTIFHPYFQHKGEYENKKMVYGKIMDPQNSKLLDEVLAVYMQGPHTYTREDVVEIHCHGSMIALYKILHLVLRSGARLAEPGEFTKRAFLNGRLDLSQAEAVMDMIKAKAEKSYDIALTQLSGGLSERIDEIRKDLMDLLVHLAVNIDYPDEDIEEVSYGRLLEGLGQVEQKIARLLETKDAGKILREGLHTAIIGKPNVGKSSLLNGLLREARAIVTDIPGTTRDTIEELMNVKGICLKITDTAGIRATEDPVEKIGVEKSRDSFQKADLILFMMDGSVPLDREDEEIMEAIKNKKAIVLINKSDLENHIEKAQIEEMLPGKKVIKTAITEGRGIEELEEEIVQMVFQGKVAHSDQVMISNTRHISLLEKAKKALHEAMAASEEELAFELIEIDVRGAWELLGEITGETVAEDIIQEVFARFCLGK